MAKPLSGPFLGFLAVVFCAIWSSAFIATKFGLRSTPPLTMATLRFLLAGPLMLVVALAIGQSLRMSWREFGLIALLGLLNNTLYLGLTFIALKTVSAGLVSVLASLNPLFTAIFAHYLLNERMTWYKGLGLSLGIGGVSFIMRNRIGSGGDAVEGIVLALVGITALVVATVLFKRFGSRRSLLVVNGLQVTVGGIVLLPFALLGEAELPVRMDATLFVSVVYLALVVSIGGTLLWFFLLRNGPAGMVSSYHFLNPGFGLLMGAVLLGEPVAVLDLIGLLPVMIGIILVTRSIATPPIIVGTTLNKESP